MRKLTVSLIVLCFLFSSASIVFAEDLPDLPPTLEEVDEICLRDFLITMDVCQVYVTRCLVVIGQNIGQQKRACADSHNACVNAAVMEFSRCKALGPIEWPTEN
jgi:hypothetical protein